jgi:hypothetical protein
MLEDIVVATMPNDPTLSFQPGNDFAPVCIKSRLAPPAPPLCAIICAFLVSLSTIASIRIDYLWRSPRAGPARVKWTLAF